jgi:hypothetical protein
MFGHCINHLFGVGPLPVMLRKLEDFPNFGGKQTKILLTVAFHPAALIQI